LRKRKLSDTSGQQTVINSDNSFLECGRRKMTGEKLNRGNFPLSWGQATAVDSGTGYLMPRSGLPALVSRRSIDEIIHQSLRGRNIMFAGTIEHRDSPLAPVLAQFRAELLSFALRCSSSVSVGRHRVVGAPRVAPRASMLLAQGLEVIFDFADWLARPDPVTAPLPGESGTFRVTGLGIALVVHHRPRQWTYSRMPVAIHTVAERLPVHRVARQAARNFGTSASPSNRILPC